MVYRAAAALALVLAALALSACQTLSKEECVVTDWQSLGEREGAAGRSLSRFSRHVEACKETSAEPDHAAWSRGHAIGARRFCTPQNGVDAGHSGRGDPSICPADLQVGFLKGYRLGEERRALGSRRDDIGQAIERNVREADETRDTLRKKDVDELQIERALHDLRADRRRLRRELADVDDDIAILGDRIRRIGLVAPAPPSRTY